MSKTKRELLIFAAIMVVLGGILYLRFGGGGESRSPVPTSNQTSSVTSTSEVPDQSQTLQGEDPHALLSAHSPDLLLDPTLSDSAVAVRITRGSFIDPFARDRPRASQTTPRPATQQQTQQSNQDRLVEEYLPDWPEGIRYQALMGVAGEPGVYTVTFNGRVVRVDEQIPSTLSPGFVLVEASPSLIWIRKEVKSGSRTTKVIHYKYERIPPR